MPYQAPRGTHDILPSQAPSWQYLEATFRNLAEQYGYGEIRTPMFEDIEVFLRTSGETSDIVSKEMYAFKDRGDRDLCLKPEGTAPAIRAFIERQLGGTGIISRLWYCAPIFRYDRPQKGRYRQSHQLGCELIGSASPHADAEVIEMTYQFYKSIGLEQIRINLNSIGKVETRERYTNAILDHCKSFLDSQDTEFQERAHKNPLRLVDSKDPKLAELMQSVPSILDFLEDESKAHFEGVQAILVESEVPFSVDHRIVRGLDYYNDTGFEVQSELLGAQSSLCGGGRYDSLVKKMGGPDIPAFGVGIGMERALIVREELGLIIEENSPIAYVVNAAPQSREAATKLTRKLRSLGLRVQYDLDGRALKQQMKQADKSKAKFAIIIGEDELARGDFALKNLTTIHQESLNFENLVARLQQRGD